jgi:hypothetical protein
MSHDVDIVSDLVSWISKFTSITMKLIHTELRLARQPQIGAKLGFFEFGWRCSALLLYIGQLQLTMIFVLISPFLSSICFSALNPRPHILLSNNCLPIYNWGNRFVYSSFPSQSRGFIRQTTFPKPELSSVWAGDGLGLHDDKLLYGKTKQK